jgi:1-acyl-sn-glycerol-3-phosphate acyltransferase
VLWWFLRALLSVPWTLAFRWRPGAARIVPRTGPYLLLANHTSVFDPVWAAFWMRRRASFMASGALFRVPLLGRVLPVCGCFPKAKFVKDRESMETLAERYAGGDVIVLFPEGTRSWDGRRGTLLPGIGRLILRLDATVVTARITTGHLFQPRWARWPRYVPIRVDHDPAMTFGADQSAEEITAVVAGRLVIDVDVEAPPWSFGFRIAEGLPSYLWACPACFVPDALQVTGRRRDHVTCDACGADWRLDLSNRLHGELPLRVHQAYDRVAGHFGSPPLVDASRPDVPLTDTGSLLRLKGREREVVATGRIVLTRDALQLVGDPGMVLWTAQLSELQAVSVEVANALTFRLDGALLQLDTSSPLKWAHFLREWVRTARVEG